MIQSLCQCLPHRRHTKALRKGATLTVARGYVKAPALVAVLLVWLCGERLGGNVWRRFVECLAEGLVVAPNPDKLCF